MTYGDSVGYGTRTLPVAHIPSNAGHTREGGRSQNMVQPLHKIGSGIPTMPPAGAPKRGAGFVWAKHGKELLAAGRAEWNSGTTMNETVDEFKFTLRSENISCNYGSGKKVYRLSGSIAGRPMRLVSERNKLPVNGKSVYLSLAGNEFVSADGRRPEKARKPSMEAIALKTKDQAAYVQNGNNETALQLKVLPSFMHRTFSSLKDPERENLNPEAFTRETRHFKWKAKRFVRMQKNKVASSSSLSTTSTAAPSPGDHISPSSGHSSPADGNLGTTTLPAIGGKPRSSTLPPPAGVAQQVEEQSSREQGATRSSATSCTSRPEQQGLPPVVRKTSKGTTGNKKSSGTTKRGSTSSPERNAARKRDGSASIERVDAEGGETNRFARTFDVLPRLPERKVNSSIMYYDDVAGETKRKSKFHVPKSMYDTRSLSPKGSGLHLTREHRFNLEEWPQPADKLSLTMSTFDKDAAEMATLRARRNPMSQTFWNAKEHYSTQTKRDFLHPIDLAKQRRIPDKRSKSYGHGMQKQFYSTFTDGFAAQSKKSKHRKPAPSPTEMVSHSADDELENFFADQFGGAPSASPNPDAYEEPLETSRGVTLEEAVELQKEQLPQSAAPVITVAELQAAAAEQPGAATAVAEHQPMEAAQQAEGDLDSEEGNYTADGKACYKGITWAMVEGMPELKPAPKFIMLNDGSGLF
ncbi:unnamed protein product [Amoebophrya sp. A120]|nr:unnamed protein product [Amoebophrya sp. A120]|eukprot:GSA120T00001834001.1